MNYHICRHMSSQITSSSVCFDIFRYGPIIYRHPPYIPTDSKNDAPTNPPFSHPYTRSAWIQEGIISTNVFPWNQGCWLVARGSTEAGAVQSNTESLESVIQKVTQTCPTLARSRQWRWLIWAYEGSNCPKNRTCWHQTCPHKTICGKQRKSVHDNFEWGSTLFLSTKTCRSQKSACLRKHYNIKDIKKPVQWSPPFEVNLSQLNISLSPHLPPSFWGQVAGVKSWNSCSVTSGFRTMVSSLLAVFTRTRTWSAKLSCRSGEIGGEVWAGHGHITFMFVWLNCQNIDA